MAADGSSQALERFADDPTYQQLEQMLAAGRAAKAPIFKVCTWACTCSPWTFSYSVSMLLPCMVALMSHTR